MTQKVPPEMYDKPIPGPNQVGAICALDKDYEVPEPATIRKIMEFFKLVVDAPAQWIRENVVLPNRGPKYYWYHKKFDRVLPIDECYMDDLTCMYEADLEYKRILQVDRATLMLLKTRLDNCNYWNSGKYGYFGGRGFKECEGINDTFEREINNFYIKYGELPYRSSVVDAFIKQKHRMIMERRVQEQNKKYKPGEEITGGTRIHLPYEPNENTPS